MLKTTNPNTIKEKFKPDTIRVECPNKHYVLDLILRVPC